MLIPPWKLSEDDPKRKDKTHIYMAKIVTWTCFIIVGVSSFLSVFAFQMNGQLSSLITTVKNINTSMEKSERDMSAYLTKHDNVLAKYGDQLGKHDTRITVVEHKINSVNTKIQDVNTKIDNVKITPVKNE